MGRIEPAGPAGRPTRGRGGEGTAPNMPDCHLTGSVPEAVGMGGMGICADTPAHKLPDEPAGLIDLQSG